MLSHLKHVLCSKFAPSCSGPCASSSHCCSSGTLASDSAWIRSCPSRASRGDSWNSTDPLLTHNLTLWICLHIPWNICTRFPHIGLHLKNFFTVLRLLPCWTRWHLSLHTSQDALFALVAPHLEPLPLHGHYGPCSLARPQPPRLGSPAIHVWHQLAALPTRSSIFFITRQGLHLLVQGLDSVLSSSSAFIVHMGEIRHFSTLGMARQQSCQCAAPVELNTSHLPTCLCHWNLATPCDFQPVVL